MTAFRVPQECARWGRAQAANLGICKKHAQECRRLAAISESADQRATLLKIAEMWDAVIAEMEAERANDKAS